MRSLQNIQSLTSFKRNTVESVEQLKKSQSPLILTVNGKAELVVLGAEDYENLLERVERAERIKAIQYGIEAFEKGEYKPAREALTELQTKYEL